MKDLLTNDSNTVIIFLIALGLITLVVRDVVMPTMRRNRIIRDNRDLATLNGMANYFKALAEALGYDTKEEGK